MSDEFRITLEGSASKSKVVFNAMPTFNESNSAKYSEIPMTHTIGNIFAYDHSPSRQFNLTDIKLISRNPQEARTNLDNVMLLRSWTKSYFGASNNAAKLGAPPEVLYFSAYSSNSHRGHFYKIPVVLIHIDVTYPNDVDYIPTAYSGAGDTIGGTPFPILTTISLQLQEQHSARELEKFNLDDYRLGKLDGF
jgi:hypothetical protein